jgi:quercetin dioxygenase-like cupin family protein
MDHALGVKKFTRRTILCGCCAALTGARIVPSFAALGDDPDSAPLARDEAHHHVLLQNDSVRIMRVLIPPSDATGWHEHNFDYVVVAVNGTKIHVDVRGNPQAIEGTMETSSVGYTNYAGKHFVHRVANRSDTVNHQLAFEILRPTPGSFVPSDRSLASQYKMETDNDRVRVWRLKLAPGEVAHLIDQKAPAVRVVLSGERLLETDSNGQVRERSIKSGDFAWLPGPASRSVTNGGVTPLELVEVELK